MSTDDLNTDQAITDQDLNKADAVDQQGLTDQVAQDQNQDALADGTDPNKTVPYAKLKEAADARKVAEDGQKAAEEQAAYAQRQLDLMAINAQATQQVQQPQSVEAQALANLGITEDDLFGANTVKFTQEVNKLNSVNQQQRQAAMSTQQFMMSTPDLAQVVGSVNPMNGIIIAPTPEVLALVQKKQYLATASTQGLYEAVLEERQIAEFKKTAAINKEALTRQNADITTKPLGGSAAGGGGSGSQGSQGYMTREQVTDIDRRLAAGEIIS